MNEYLFIRSEGWIQVGGPPSPGSTMRFNCINEGSSTIELMTKDTPPFPTETGVSLTSKRFNYQEATAVLQSGDTLYARVRGDEAGHLMVGEII